LGGLSYLYINLGALPGPEQARLRRRFGERVRGEDEMHPELARLLHPARRRPDDPLARLVLADWLGGHRGEQGRERGRFIRLQNELEALRPHQRGRAGLARQAAALRAAHEADWVGDLADWAEGWDFPRGLLALQLREGADDGALDDLAVRPLFA